MIDDVTAPSCNAVWQKHRIRFGEAAARKTQRAQSGQ